MLAAACGDDDDDVESGNGDESTDESSDDGGGEGGDFRIGLVYDVGGRGDQSFNDAAYEGLTRASEERGVEIQDLEPEGGGENREELLRTRSEEHTSELKPLTRSSNAVSCL